MNRQRTTISLGSIFLLAGAALLLAWPRVAPSAGKPGTWLRPDSAVLDSQFDLQCDIKVPQGLAQCGSQASSCKNCHEVKGEDPVNAEGEWHVSHAFGDFCEFCHGGNVQAVDRDAAHQGLVTPLGDVKANCSSCHEDYEGLAQTYATALGVTIGVSDGGSAAPPSQPSAPSEPDTPSPEPASDAGLAPSDGEIVDYAAEYTSGGAPQISPGNLVVGGLLVLTIAGGAAFITWNEKRLRNLRLPISDRGLEHAISSAQAGIVSPPSDITSELSPELTKLLPMLQALDPRTLRALRIILSDRRRGEELLQSLSLINFSVLEEMKRLDKRELSLLLALASET
jgi:hypothetical protein